MQTIFFIFLASALNAIMDTITHHFSTSIFKNLNPKFWNSNESWKHTTLIFGRRNDAWHIAKSLMIFSLVAAVVFYTPICHLKQFTPNVNKLIDWCTLGVVWNTTFNLFYNKILR